MAGIHPVVRYLIACENVMIDPDDPNRVSLLNLLSAIRSLGDPPYPLRFPELCLYLQLSGCRGPADGRIDIVHADSDRTIFRSRTRHPVPDRPARSRRPLFSYPGLRFPEAGLYWLQFWYNQYPIAQAPLLLKG